MAKFTSVDERQWIHEDLVGHAIDRCHDRAVQHGLTAVREADFFSLFAPRRFGAHEADPHGRRGAGRARPR
jgi:hypothetical protein